MSEMTDEFDALLKSLRMLAGDWKDDIPANGSFHADGISEGMRGCGRKLQQLLDDYAEGAQGKPPIGAERYAHVEQLGHRSMVGITRDITFCGKTMLEVQRIDVVPSVTVRVNPDTFYDVTDLTPEQAVAMARAYGRSTGGLDAAGVVTRAISEHRQITAAARDEDEDGDPWGTAESDLADADADEGEGEGEDDGMTVSEPRAADEARDLAPGAEAHPWFRPAGVAAAPVNPIEADARRAVGWVEDQPQQQGAPNGAGAQLAQRMML